MKKDRFYFRGWSRLGLFNTLIACLFNLVLVIARDESNKLVNWWFDKATNWPQREF